LIAEPSIPWYNTTSPVIRLRADNDVLILGEWVDGNKQTTNISGADISSHLNETLTVDVTATSDGLIEATLSDSTGSVLATETLSASSQIPETGGIQYRIRNTNTAVTAYFDGKRPEDPVERAGRFFFLRYAQFAGDISMKNGFKVRAKRSPARTFDNARYRLEELAERFRDVIIENRDYQRIFSTYDDTDVDVLYYCDPPYTKAKDGYYRGPRFDHAQFVDELARVDGHWMVSYGDPPDDLEDLATTVVERSYNRSAGKDNSDRTERLYLSYDPAATPRFVDGQQQTLVTSTDGGNDHCLHTDTEQGGSR